MLGKEDKKLSQLTLTSIELEELLTKASKQGAKAALKEMSS